MIMWIAAAIAAGAQMLNGVMAHEDKKDERKDKKEALELELQDKERDRQAQLLRLKEQMAAQAAIQKASDKANNMGDLILKQGDASNAALLESFRAKANKPERFNDSADNLARVLAGRGQ